jgi:hypothetical protein
LFDTTFTNAAVNRYATSSIVTGVTLSAVTIAFGAITSRISDRSEAARRVAPCGSSAVAIGRRSWHAV